MPSGLYRDALPTLMLLLDQAVSAVKDLDEADNPIRANVRRTRQALEARGIPAAEAERLAAVRASRAAALDRPARRLPSTCSRWR